MSDIPNARHPAYPRRHAKGATEICKRHAKERHAKERLQQVKPTKGKKKKAEGQRTKSAERIAGSQTTPGKPALGHERLLAERNRSRASLLTLLQLLVLHLGAEFGRPALGGVPVAEAVHAHRLGIDAGTVVLFETLVAGTEGVAGVFLTATEVVDGEVLVTHFVSVEGFRGSEDVRGKDSEVEVGFTVRYGRDSTRCEQDEPAE